MNKYLLTGRLGADPELKTGASGVEYCDFRLAVDRYQGKEKGNITEWFNCRSFGKVAVMVATYFKKGDGIELEGHMESSKKDDKTYWNYIVERAEFPKEKKSRGDSAPTTTSSGSEAAVPGFTPMDEGECPF